jgi:hypothetical protein
MVLVAGIVTGDRGLYTVVSEEFPGMVSTFSSNQCHVLQDFQSAERDVLQITDGGGNYVKRARCCNMSACFRSHALFPVLYSDRCPVPDQ